MTIDEIKKETRFWQRMLRLAGYYTGKIDGIRGKLQRAAEKKWEDEQATALNVYGELDARSEGNLQTILPRVQLKLRHWLAEAIPAAKAQGYTLKVICGTRSYDEQNTLYAQGRTKPGSRVTNAKGGYSNHNFGIAIDIGLFDDANGGKYVESDAPYRKLAKACPPPPSITWGGSWASFPDTPHYQSNLFGNSTKEIRTQFNA